MFLGENMNTSLWPAMVQLMDRCPRSAKFQLNIPHGSSVFNIFTSIQTAPNNQRVKSICIFLLFSTSDLYENIFLWNNTSCFNGIQSITLSVFPVFFELRNLRLVFTRYFPQLFPLIVINLLVFVQDPITHRKSVYCRPFLQPLYPINFSPAQV